MRTIEEIMSAMAALMQGADGRLLTDEEIAQYEALEAELTATRASAAARGRHGARMEIVGPVPAGPAGETQNELPYAFRTVRNRLTGDVRYLLSNTTRDGHNFSVDLATMFRARDEDGTATDAGRRVMAMIRATFMTPANISSGDVDETNPEINYPNRYVDVPDYRTPILDLIGEGAPPNGIESFGWPKFSSASGLVDDHTEGVEPATGTFVTTKQTVEPTAISGKASMTREVWDMVGNPSVATLVFNKMRQAWREGLESAAATFLVGVAGTAVALTTAAVDKALSANVEDKLADLPFLRGYDFRAWVLEKVLYKALAAARDDNGRPIYPIIGPANANGTAAPRFRMLDIAGLIGVPSWALASTAGSVNKSPLFDPDYVHGWWTEPQRLEFPGTKPSDGSYAPVAYVDLAIFGYKAFACSDTGAVRQLTYDSVA